MPGKLRIARFALRRFRKMKTVRMPDRFGNTLCCPSLEESIALAIFANGVSETDTVAGIVSRLPRNGVYLDVGTNIGAIALAVARQRPDVRVICVEAEFGMGSVGPQFNRPPILLRQVALDELLDDMGIGDVDVIKLDVEGSELGVLQGLMRRLTASRFTKVLFEFCDWAEERVGGQQPGAAQASLHSLGYRHFDLRVAEIPVC
jgi:Methyltransferase FkbM domain